ncbi:hypothetical protein ANO11243_040330 [Dothideomycetidae sp. 11243]|nr:hypothetical protein ANO11243_040330 [fungal sp. No.11243]
MRLVEYASSDSDSDTHNDNNNEAPPPPLPAAFHDLYAGPPRLSRTDDPSLHGGRTRLVPHVEGNWAAHIYLEWHPTKAEHDLLSTLLAAAIPSSTTPLTSLLASALAPLPLHVSLSAPLILRSETKDAFRASMTTALGNALRSLPDVAAAGCLKLSPARVAWYPNNERTRGFLVLQLATSGQDGGRPLEVLLRAANAVAERNGCPQLYADERGLNADKCHISIGWGLEPDAFPMGPVDLPPAAAAIEAEVQKMSIGFSDVKVKIGRDVTSVPFARTKPRHT